ncbi:P2Y purinoceptor 4-like [Engraulis encrasicolus]|uniref:P2Y purinoceptor 4-like n=1 Tax=Engraulis encrasicolus TaxID=184585 RepID=UPI002FD17A54
MLKLDHMTTMNPTFPQLNDTTMNHTEKHFDFYCLEFPVGPMILSILSSPCALVGVPASVWLLWTLIQRQRSSSGGGSSKNNDIYMLHLSVFDVLSTTQLLPYTLNFNFWRNDLFKSVQDFILALNFMGRPLVMTCICCDCYMAVCYPIFYMRMKSSHYTLRLVTSAVAWAVAIGWATLTIFIFVAKMPDVLLSIPYFLTLPVIVGCDVAILRALRKPDPSGKTAVHPQKQRALLTIAQSLVLTVLVFLPPLVMLGITPLIPLTKQERFCSVITPALFAPGLASMIMPLMHLHSLGSFRDLRWCGCRVE